MPPASLTPVRRRIAPTPTPPAYFVGQSQAAGTTVSIAVAVPTGLGDAILVGASTSLTASAPTAVGPDSKGNVYRQLAIDNTNLGFGGWIADGLSNLGGPAALTTSDTIPVTFASASGTHTSLAVAVRGVAPYTVDQLPATTDGTSTSPSITSGTLRQPNEVAVALKVNANAGGRGFWAAGWTPLVYGLDPSGLGQQTSFAYQVESTTSAVTASALITSAPWTMLLVTLMLAPGSVQEAPATMAAASSLTALAALAAPATLAAAAGLTALAVQGAAAAMAAGAALSPLGAQDATVTMTAASALSLAEAQLSAASMAAAASLSPLAAQEAAANLAAAAALLPGGVQGTLVTLAVTGAVTPGSAGGAGVSLAAVSQLTAAGTAGFPATPAGGTATVTGDPAAATVTGDAPAAAVTGAALSATVSGDAGSSTVSGDSGGASVSDQLH